MYNKLIMSIKKCIFRLLAVIIIAQISHNIYAQTPIARFDAVPFQRIDAGETFNVGIIAFSKSGIDRVEFTVKGQGYVGVNPLVSNEMTNNPTTGVYEYWVPVRANDFISDGSIEIEAVVFGKDGGTRNKNWLINNSIGTTYTVNNWHIVDGNHYEYLCSITGTGLFNKDMVFSNAIIYNQTDNWWNGITVNIKSADANKIEFKYGDSYGTSPVTLDYQPKSGDGFILSRGFGLDPLILLVNPLGTLPQPVAFVDIAGADGTGVVNSSEKPFATTGGAMVAMRDWMNSNGYGNQINGGVIKLNPGTHTQSNGGYWGNILSKNEWVTFTSNHEMGGSKENTFITGSGMVQTQFVKVEDLSIIANDVLSNVFSVSSNFYPIFKLWIEDCNLEGTTKYNEDTSPVSSSFVW